MDEASKSVGSANVLTLFNIRAFLPNTWHSVVAGPLPAPVVSGNAHFNSSPAWLFPYFFQHFLVFCRPPILYYPYHYRFLQGLRLGE
ncbi:MAG: hypothetical protein LBB48_02290 [Treponema sp.]|nr:hypothetical protein [Treponema sp.]